MTADRPASGAEVVAFGDGAGAGPEPAALSVERLGAKAVHLIRMAGAGLSVPPGFVLSTDVCRRYHRDGSAALDPVMAEVQGHVGALEARLDRGFCAARRPLLLSVRSGAAQSMPGMLETVLNVGLNRATISGLLRTTGNPRFVWDCFRRLVQQYAEVVEGLGAEPFADLVEAELAKAGVDALTDLDFAHLELLAEAFLLRFRSLTGRDFPDDPQQQLRAAVEAVLRSWMSDKARTYRRLRGLSDAGGTAVTVQAMVFGNVGPTSGSGVAFTRDPRHRRETPLCRFLLRRPGRGCRLRAFRRHWSTAPGGNATRRVGGAPANCDAPGGRVARYAGLRVHRRERPAVAAAVPPRLAFAAGGGAHRRRPSSPTASSTSRPPSTASPASTRVPRAAPPDGRRG